MVLKRQFVVEPVDIGLCWPRQPVAGLAVVFVVADSQNNGQGQAVERHDSAGELTAAEVLGGGTELYAEGLAPIGDFHDDRAVTAGDLDVLGMIRQFHRESVRFGASGECAKSRSRVC